MIYTAVIVKCDGLIPNRGVCAERLEVSATKHQAMRQARERGWVADKYFAPCPQHAGDKK